MASPNDEKSIRASAFYARRTDELRSAISENLSHLWRYTMSLVLIGILTCAVFYLAIVAKRLPIWAPILVLSVGAVALQKRHQHQRRFMQLSSLAEYYEKGLARLDRKWELLDGGERFIDQDHFYSTDLDLFGQAHSINYFARPNPDRP